MNEVQKRICEHRDDLLVEKEGLLNEKTGDKSNIIQENVF